eukprot:361013-Chlamydomonas_euryale.AAC.5
MGAATRQVWACSRHFPRHFARTELAPLSPDNSGVPEVAQQRCRLPTRGRALRDEGSNFYQTSTPVLRSRSIGSPAGLTPGAYFGSVW